MLLCGNDSRNICSIDMNVNHNRKHTLWNLSRLTSSSFTKPASNCVVLCSDRANILRKKERKSWKALTSNKLLSSGHKRRSLICSHSALKTSGRLSRYQASSLKTWGQTRIIPDKPGFFHQWSETMYFIHHKIACLVS